MTDIDTRLDALEQRLGRMANVNEGLIERQERADTAMRGLIERQERVDTAFREFAERWARRHSELLTYLEGLDAGQSALVDALIDIQRRFLSHRADGHGAA
jgi:chromosome segregation ATPase